MNKIERVTRALKRQEVDRPPFSFWYHFGLQFGPGRKHAEAEIDFFRAYDPDFLKVMNDYPYPLPQGMDFVRSEDDWKRLEPLRGDAGQWAEELDALSAIHNAIGREALFIETIFSPWTTARRMARQKGLSEAMKNHPETLLAAMDVIATSLASYAREAVARGAAGIFLSLGAATGDVMTDSEYRTWCRPFDLKVLEAVREAPFNVLHVHGNHILFDLVADYPASAFNWSHFLTPPSLEEGMRKTGKAVMGGIEESNASHVTTEDLAGQISGAIREAGPLGLLVTPGCSIPTDTPVRLLKSVRPAIEAAVRD